ncbi:MAG: hypothetical protein J6Z41_08065 [Prevotella sp.]|nr:hypothetical protein [Prevotella sp.]
MKKIFTLALLAVFAMGASAQTVKKTQTDENVKVTVAVQSSDDLAKVPIDFGFINKTEMDMASFETSIYFDGFRDKVTLLETVNEDGDPVPDVTLNGDVCKSGHAAMAGFHEVETDRFIMSVASSGATKASKQFKKDGTVATANFSMEGLADGEYTINVKKAAMTWTDAATTKQYDTDDFDVKFKVENGKVIGSATGITTITTDEVPAAKKGIYTLQGVKVKETVPGNIYIIDGKKVAVK